MVLTEVESFEADPHLTLPTSLEEVSKVNISSYRLESPLPFTKVVLCWLDQLSLGAGIDRVNGFLEVLEAPELRSRSVHHCVVAPAAVPQVSLASHARCLRVPQ